MKLRSFRLLAAFLAISPLCFPQSESGSAALEGVVTDPSGKPVISASIDIRSEETGYRRKTASAGDGRFAVPVVPVGTYSVDITAEGFGKATFAGVRLTVGHAEFLNARLQLASVSTEVNVSADPSPVDPDQTATATSISERAVRELPIRGRNFTEFAQLTPAIVQESDRNGLVISGQRSINSNVAIDGADFNDALQGNQRGGNQAVFFFPQSAVREFQVVRSGATAEVGRTGAGFVNVVTRSGTNDIHGEAFYLHRNKNLTSPDAFNRSLDNRQNQFGGGVGGAIRKDKAFYYVAAEQNLLRVPFVVKFQQQAAGVTVPAELRALEGEQRGTNNPFSLFARQDTILSQKHFLSAHFNYSRMRGQNFNFDSPQLDQAVTANYTLESSSYAGKLALTSVPSPAVVHEIRGQIATDDRFEKPNAETAQIVIAGFGTLGSDTGRPRRFETLRYQLTDNLSWNPARHRVRFGMDLNINDARQQRESNIQGRYDFTNLPNYLAGRIGRYRQTLPGFDPKELIYSAQQQELAFFATDKIDLARGLSLNYGVRWEGQWNPQPPRPNPLLPQTRTIPNDLGQWQPRLGLVWSPRKNGGTVIRLSGGILSARTPANLFQRVFTNNGLTTAAVDTRFDPALLNALRFPNPLTALPTGIRVPQPRVFGFADDFRNPRSYQFAATLEQAIGRDVVVSAGYIHNSTQNLQRRLDRNLFPPTINAAGVAIFPSNRPIPSIGWFSVNESSAHSDYNALALTLSKRFSRRYQIQANYTFAKNYDDDSNERNFSRETTLNVYDLRAERAPSKQDVRHNFNVNSVVDLPLGFTFSGILIARSAFPFTPTIGFDTQGDGNDDNDRAIIGGRVAARNSLRQPNFFDLDLRLLKSFSLGDKVRLAVSLEGFNVTRATNKNFGNDSISLYGTAQAPVATAGQPLFAPSSARFGGPRQLQLGARFTF